MARLLGPDANSRFVYVTLNGALRSAAHLTATIYSAATGSTLANVAVYDGTSTPGAVISDATLTVDTDSLLPRFWFPDGVDTVYVSVNGGTRVAVNADYDARIDAALPLAGGTLTGSLVIPTGTLTVGGFGLPILAPLGRRPSWRSATTLFNLGASGHGWASGGAGTASSDVNSTAQFVRGTQSARLTTTGDGAQSQIRKTGISSMNLAGKMIRVLLRVDDVTHLNLLQFTIGSSTFANFFKWTIHTHSATNPNYVQSGEWVLIHFSWADVESAGGTCSIGADGQPSTKSGFTDLQLSAKDNATGAITYHLQSVEIVNDTTATFSGGVCSITFDDSWKSVIDYARPKMDALGFRGTSYQIVDLVDADTSHVSLADLRALQNLSGWEIAAHAYTSSAHSQANGYADLTAAQVDTEFKWMKAWLVTNGFNGDGLAYPKGRFANTTDGVAIDQIAARYWTSARSIISETKETFAPAAYHRLKAITGVNDGTALGGTTVTALTAAGGPLDRCQLSGDWLILCFHKLVTGTPATSDEISQTGFNTVMDAINSRSIPVLPVTDALRYYT
jgi:hypothetical protein